ncbi:dolichol-phosphate mannosyltransferase subunit 3 [Auricularia subglabra TFB-10046 SS5]|nr:dolichol-phosphate mannosyltransferase subunit 3 [Auricularia subglabra TFB-10046 SS5]
MTRANTFFSFGSMAVGIYVALMCADLPEPASLILPVLPWWLLVSFGSYSLWTLGWAMLSFRECPEAYEELTKEVEQAKQDLRRRGVDVD